MASRHQTSSPTPVELAILQVLWKRGRSTVREIHRDLNNRTRQSTTLKMVQVMTEKGLIRKDDSVRPQVYRAAQAAKHTQLRLIDELIQRAFSGSASQLVMRAASAKRITPLELAQIKQLIERATK